MVVRVAHCTRCLIMCVLSGLLYEEGEDADAGMCENLSLTLADSPGGGIRDDCVILVEDFVQDLEVCVLTFVM